jgi:hypothetical protein
MIRASKSRRMRFAGHVARLVRWKMRTKLWFGSLKGREQSEDQGVDGRIILECDSRK